MNRVVWSGGLSIGRLRGMALVGLLVAPMLTAEATPPASMMIDGIEVQDPTRPLDWRPGSATSAGAAVTRPKIVVNSILVSSARRLAIVNGRSVVEGDTVDGVRVQRISADGVSLRWQGEQWTARLTTARGAVRQPARTQP